MRGRIALAIAVVLAGFLAATVLSVAVSLHALNQSQRQWCGALTLLTHGAPAGGSGG